MGGTGLLVGGIVGVLLALMAWLALRVRGHRPAAEPPEQQGDILIVLLAIAAFLLGVFLTYGLLYKL
jgi:hypothetical protein